MTTSNRQTTPPTASSKSKTQSLEDQFKYFLDLIKPLRKEDPQRYRGYLLRLSDKIIESAGAE